MYWPDYWASIRATTRGHACTNERRRRGSGIPDTSALSHLLPTGRDYELVSKFKSHLKAHVGFKVLYTLKSDLVKAVWLFCHAPKKEFLRY